MHIEGLDYRRYLDGRAKEMWQRTINRRPDTGDRALLRDLSRIYSAIGETGDVQGFVTFASLLDRLVFLNFSRRLDITAARLVGLRVYLAVGENGVALSGEFEGWVEELKQRISGSRWLQLQDDAVRYLPETPAGS